MELSSSKAKPGLSLDIEAAAGLIANSQKPDGEIPWAEGDKTDPWDLVEAAMGLNVGGRRSESERAFEWMARNQLEDGSWYASYRDGRPEDRTRDTNMSSYLAVGVLHHHLITGDRAFLEAMWPAVRAGLDFALGLQAPSGEIYWAMSPEGRVDPVGLLTGSSSVFMSLKCGLTIARLLGRDRPDWREAFSALGEAIRFKRHRFNMTKSRYSMDWFYPILSGALTGTDAQRRLDKYWDRFVVEDRGVLCVSDQPWVTMAETSELTLALQAMGKQDLARIMFSWILDCTFDDGSYWCGFTHPNMVIWPEDKITWTNAVVLMAADALYNLTPAGQLFNHDSWDDSGHALLVE
ncbi:MAG: phenyltransferase domain-containing protein [Proteobacteria bacterium]|nr:phenyltransferase domain-containing protein [Pseudomonadota bacterium]